MKTLPIILFTFVLAGCISHPTANDLYPWIFPTAEFSDEGKTSFREDMISMSEKMSRNLKMSNLKPFDFAECKQFLCSAHGTNETERMLLDPFHCRQYDYVRFDTFTPAGQLVHYYERVFRDNGWEFERGLISLEETQSGGDTVRVYKKCDALVRLHVFGPLTEPKDNGRGGSLAVWHFELSFIGIKPQDLLGNKYRFKGKEIFSSNYHIAEVICNRWMTENASNQASEAIAPPGGAQPQR